MSRLATAGLVVMSAVLAAAAVAALVLTGRPHSPTNADDPPGEAGAITVGQERYLSPCRLLLRETLEEIFGPLGADAGVTEYYRERSLPDPRERARGAVSVCAYEGDWGLSVTVAQRVAPAVRAGDRIPGLRAREGVLAAMSAYRQVDVGDDPAAAALLRDLEAGQEIYERPMDASLSEVEGMVVAEFRESADQVIRDLMMVTPAAIITLSQRTAEAPEAGSTLSRFARARTVVLANAENPDLSQAPVASFGESGQFGDTTLIEPCAVLSAEAFTEITGAGPNGPVTRHAEPLVLPDPSSPRAMEGIEGGCSRTFAGPSVPPGPLEQGERRYGKHGSVQVQLTLTTYPDVSSAQAGIQQHTEQQDGELLDTRADAAVVRGSARGDVAHFRVGPYVGSLEMYASVLVDPIDLSAETAEAINTLVDSINGQL